MVLRLFQWAGLLFVLAGISLGADTAARGKLIGTWRQGIAGDHPGAIWSLQAEGDSIRIAQSLDGQKVFEFECNTMGRECELKDSGRRIKVSMWFNGPKLVALETRGAEVIKRRFKVIEQGDLMEIELIPIAPAGKTEVVQLRRIPMFDGRK